MGKIFSLFLIRIINKILFFKRSIHYTSRNNTKNALVSYVLVPSIYIPFYYKSSHNNKFQCFLLIEFLKSKGYNVFLHYYLDTNIDTTIKYDLFIGHNETFAKIANKLQYPSRKILIGTGSEPNFGNLQQKIRIDDLNSRKNVDLKIYEDNIVPDLDDNYQVADTIILFGNTFVKDTYHKKYRTKIELINNVTLHPYFKRTTKPRNNNFLFISSVGQVHRGLDLLLDIFSNLPNKLYVLSAFEDEPEFVRIYYRELYQTPNIRAVGYIDLNSPAFKTILNDVDFVVLPSCSEGQSSSIINMITYGLIPVIPQNVGLPNVSTIGIEITSVDIEGVNAAVNEAINLPQKVYEEKKSELSFTSKKFSSDSYVARLAEIIK